jgi:hypothetical protein
MQITAPASLEDITPTVVDALGLTPRTAFDGTSWLPELRGTPQANRAARFRFMETEFAPPGLASGDIVSVSSVRGAAAFYRVDPVTDRVFIRPERLPGLLANRQYAVVRGEQMLAAVPSDDAEEQHLLYLPHADAEPVWFASPPDASSGAAHELWAALYARFDYVRQRPVAPPLGDID